VEGLSRSTSCIDPVRSRTRLLSLLHVSRRLFPPHSVRFPVRTLFLPPLPSFPSLPYHLPPRDRSPALFLPSFLAPRSSSNPFEGNAACLPAEGLRFRACGSLFSVLVSELSACLNKMLGFQRDGLQAGLYADKQKLCFLGDTASVELTDMLLLIFEKYHFLKC